MRCSFLGWSHFVQFTIAVVNKDPKKSKYSGKCYFLSAFLYVEGVYHDHPCWIFFVTLELDGKKFLCWFLSLSLVCVRADVCIMHAFMKPFDLFYLLLLSLYMIFIDTLHRFCKKEHDWGWKKFMELSKVLDGFTVADTLVIKAQVQVIRFVLFWLVTFL